VASALMTSAPAAPGEPPNTSGERYESRSNLASIT
jgi:hypothetical protein